jgi:signal transduction histidine kinase
MLSRLNDFLARWTLIQRFTFASFIIMILGMVGIGGWVGEQIRVSVIKNAGATTADYMDSFIAPNVQELANSISLTPEHYAALSSLLSETELGRQTVTIKIWHKSHRVVYSNIPALVGQIFPPSDKQNAAWLGGVSANINNLQDEEYAGERRLYTRLLEIYSPVRLNGSDEIIAVAEFYIKVDALEARIAATQRRSWLIVGTTMAVIYLLLIGFVQYAGNTIGRIEGELKGQVDWLTELLIQNDELNKRVRRAAENTAAINERFLRRTHTELRNGPVQEISLALARLNRVKSLNETCRVLNPNAQCSDHLPAVKESLQTALQEIQAIAAGLGLPELEDLTLPEILTRVVRTHEGFTGTKVMLSISDLPEKTPLAINITAYRLIQEALNNAHNHAGGVGQQVRVRCETNNIFIEVSDKGPGFDVTRPVEWKDREHLGLTGMRERVESLGGLFRIESKINEGTRVIVRLSLQNTGDYAYG